MTCIRCGSAFGGPDPNETLCWICQEMVDSQQEGTQSESQSEGRGGHAEAVGEVHSDVGSKNYANQPLVHTLVVRGDDDYYSLDGDAENRVCDLPRGSYLIIKKDDVRLLQAFKATAPGCGWVGTYHQAFLDVFRFLFSTSTDTREPDQTENRETTS